MAKKNLTDLLNALKVWEPVYNTEGKLSRRITEFSVGNESHFESEDQKEYAIKFGIRFPNRVFSASMTKKGLTLYPELIEGSVKYYILVGSDIPKSTTKYLLETPNHD